MKENKQFPGLPNYTGPTEGLFGFLHHGVIAETSHDVMERVKYVKAFKPKYEIPIRLRCMVHLPISSFPKHFQLKADGAIKTGVSHCIPRYSPFAKKALRMIRRRVKDLPYDHKYNQLNFSRKPKCNKKAT